MSKVRGRWSEAEANALSASVGLFLRRDPESREDAGQDFGHIERGAPWAVVAPRDTRELDRLVGFAGSRALPITPRGRGYSQSGQSLSPDGLTLDCTRLDRIQPVEPGVSRLRCEAGARWREVVSATLPHGMLPTVLPLNLDMTVGGLLSAGGIGANSHRHGPAAAHTIELEVATATRGLVRCDRNSRSDLYFAMLAGLGRCGVISQVTLALRPVRPRVRTFHLLYGDFETWLGDQRTLVRSERADYLEGFTWSSAKGIRSDHMGRRQFSHWLHGLQLGLEYAGAPPEPSDALAGLNPWRVVEVEDDDIATHVDRYQSRFDIMRRSGAWQRCHPWFECLVPASRLHELLPELLDTLPPSIGDGHRLVWMARDNLPPLFAAPEAEELVCLGILPTGVAPFERDLVLQIFRQLDHNLRAAGGKRYLSGWLGRPETEYWRGHFGKHYDRWIEAKRLLDPEGIFRSALFPGP